MKKCSKCKEDKPMDGFYNEKAREGGKKAVCKKCCAATVLKWRNANREQHLYNKRKNRIEGKYNITLSEYEEYLEKPCAICTKDSEVLDHNHTTGEIRGGLCNKCNRALGLLGDDISVVGAAHKYLINRGSYGGTNEC